MKTKEDILKYKPAVFAAGVGRCIRISDAEAAMDEWLRENKPEFPTENLNFYYWFVNESKERKVDLINIEFQNWLKQELI